MFASQVMSAYLLHLMCCQNLNQVARSSFSPRFVTDKFSKLKPVLAAFFRSQCQSKGNFHTLKSKRAMMNSHLVIVGSDESAS